MTATGMTRWSLCEIRLMKNRTLYLLFSSAADDIAIQFTSTLAPLSCSRGEMRPEPTSNKDILRWIVARELRYHSSRGQLMSLSLNPADIWKIFSDGKRRNKEELANWLDAGFKGHQGGITHQRSSWGASGHCRIVCEERTEAARKRFRCQSEWLEVAVCACFAPKVHDGTGTLRCPICSVTYGNNNLRC
jgi:hypothetical protein